MTNKRWVAGSRRLYGWLIKVYPKEHVAEYGTAMQQVFTDQTSEISKEQGLLGLVFLWMRTLIDLGKTAVSEHVHARHAGMGLPEIAPLIWMDTLLVLVPSLMLLISYVALLIWNSTSIYWMEFWFNLLCAIPILWVWWRRKTFPVWGLLPAGIILYLVFETIYKIPFRLNGFHTGSWLLLTALFLTLIISLGWRYTRLWHPSRRFYVWLGVCLLANLTQVVLMIFYSRFYSWQVSNWNWTAALSESLRNNYPTVWFVVQETTGLLLFVVCTTMFARKFGNLSVLLLPGYFFSNYLSFRDTSAAAGSVYTLVLAYRLFLTILLPIWIVRASSAQSRRRGIILPAILAFLALAALDSRFGTGLLLSGLPAQYADLIVAWSVFRAVSFIAGFMLADQLGRSDRPVTKGSLIQEIFPKTVQA
jgi:hypothetical protein